MSLFRNAVSNFLSEELKPYLRSRDKKSYPLQLREMLNLLFAYRFPPYQYILHGLFKTDAPDNYIDFVPPRLMQRYLAKINAGDHAALVQNKSTFRRTLERHGLPCIREIVRRRADGRLVNADDEDVSERAATELLKQYGPRIFVKETFGSLGKGAMIIDASAGQDDMFDLPGDFLYQPVIRQHPKMEKLFPYSVNTIRIDTLKYGDGYISNGAVLKIGCNRCHVDNWGAGGILIGINIENGRLYKSGKQKTKFGGGVFDAHPDTGVIFADFQIPYWQDILDVVAKAAETLAPLVSLGWDVAVMPDGPVLVEANHNWHTSLMQEGNGGMAKTKLGKLTIQDRGS